MFDCFCNLSITDIVLILHHIVNYYTFMEIILFCIFIKYVYNMYNQFFVHNTDCITHHSLRTPYKTVQQQI